MFPKATGQSVRICNDYNGTVNPAIQTEQFPIPTMEEIGGRVSSLKKFTKVDLRTAYQLFVLHQESQELCTINTRKSLFRDTRFIEQVLAGIEGTCVIMDDLLVGGANDSEHLTNLEAVFKQFQKYGLSVKLPKCECLVPSVVYFGMRFS